MLKIFVFLCSIYVCFLINNYENLKDYLSIFFYHLINEMFVFYKKKRKIKHLVFLMLHVPIFVKFIIFSNLCLWGESSHVKNKIVCNFQYIKYIF